MTRISAVVLSVVLVACGGSGSLDSAEKEWCRFSADSAEAADRFDLIFDTGLGLGLAMDAVNARASALRAEYEADGVTPDAAIARVSDDLFEDETFIEACKAAYAQHGADE